MELYNVRVDQGVVQEDLLGQVIQLVLGLDLLGVNHLECGKVALFPVADLVDEAVGPAADHVRAQVEILALESRLTPRMLCLLCFVLESEELARCYIFFAIYAIIARSILN